jgi:microcystin-dependent protein
MALVGAQFVNAVSPNPVGSLQAYAGASAPTGWLLCDGTSYSTSVYPELFSVLGYTYGGSAGNFNMPDLRGRVPMGAGTGAQNGGTGTGVISGGTALTARTRGAFGGDERLQSHQHNYSEVTTSGGSVNSSGDIIWAVSGGNVVDKAGFGYLKTKTTGSGGAENMPPFLVTNYIIKAVPDAPRSGLAYGSTPPIVTALPANPQFGDVVTYIADAANGVAWNLQYDATGTYPWKFIGGAPLTSEVDTDESIAAATTTYTALATAGPSITAALAGDYIIEHGARYYPGSVIQQGYMSYDIGGSAASDTDGIFFEAAAATYGTTGSRLRKKTGLSASTAIVAKYRHTSASSTVNFSRRWMSLTPVRVKAA